MTRQLFAGSGHVPRYYQTECLEAIRTALEDSRSTLAVLATGLGKTQIFCELAAKWPGRVLILAHRDELVHQARERLEKMSGEWVDVEQAERAASTRSRLVVASTDTIKLKHRLERFDPNHFSLIIADEAHHYTAKTYQRPLAHFKGAKVLGVTATPDRADEVALGRIFESVAYCMDIRQGIDAGYLTPLRGTAVELDALDLSEVKTTAGDLAVGQLDEAMLAAAEGMCQDVVANVLGPAIAFFPGVRSAEWACHRLNALREGTARFVSGDTPKEERRQIMADFKAGRFQVLCNCMVATEGFDAPAAMHCLMMRPTKSRALYAQMCGRVTRPTVDLGPWPDAEQADERRAAIAASAKPACWIRDYVGVSGKHELVTPVDLLGGDYSEQEVKLAKKKVKDNGGDIADALKQARDDIRQAAYAMRQAQIRSRHKDFDPFTVTGINNFTPMDIRFGYKPPTEPQQKCLKSYGVPEAEVHKMSFNQASKMISTLKKRRELGLATFNQLAKLRQFGWQKPNISFDNASRMMDYIASTGWGRHGVVDMQRLEVLSRGNNAKR